MHSCAYVSVVYCNGCVVAVGKHSIIIIIIIIIKYLKSVYL